jgi:hypothetical protein
VCRAGLTVLSFRGCECVLWRCVVCLGRVVVVYVNRRPSRIGRYEAGDERAQLIEGFGAVQERFCEKSERMYRTVVVGCRIRA